MKSNLISAFLTFSILIFIFDSCSIFKRKDSLTNVLTDFGWDKSCPFNRLNFDSTSQEFGVKRTVGITDSLLTGLTAGATGIEVGKAKADASINIANQFNKNINTLVEKYGTGRIKVTPDFFERWTALANSMCTLRDAMKEKLLKSKVARDKAESLYVDLLGEIARANFEEKKKL